VLYCGAVYCAVQGGCEAYRSLDKITIKMTSTEQYFPEALFNMLYNAAVPFRSLDEILSVAIQMKVFPVVCVCCFMSSTQKTLKR